MFIFYFFRYDLIQHCWMFESAKRPTFTEIVESLSDSLESMAGYVHIGAFGIRANDGDFYQ